MVWSEIEKIVGECIPECIKEILTSCAYTSLSSLKGICAENIVQIEKYVNTKRDVIANLKCSHSETYKKQCEFQFLPGHRNFILTIAKTIDKELDQLSEDELLFKLIEKNPHFSVVMKELMKTALRNGQRMKNNAEYSEIIRHFATYLFIMCGRASYTVLCKNLPLPSIPAIRKFMLKEMLRCSSVYFE